MFKNKPLKWLLLLAALLVLAASFVLEAYPPSSGTRLTKVIVENGKPVGSTIIVAFLGWLFYEYFRAHIWQGKILKFMNDQSDKVSTSMDELVNNTETKLNSLVAKTEEGLELQVKNMNDYLEKNQLGVAIAQSDPRELIETLTYIHSAAYGSHCKSDKGLYHATEKIVSRYLKADVPHRSNHTQDITIEEGDDRITWIEDTRYELHTIAVDSDYKTPHDTDAISHDLTYTTSACYTDIDQLLIEICVDDELVVTTKGAFSEGDKDVESGIATFKCSDPAITIELVDEEVEEWKVSITKLIPISKAKVMVKIHEECVLTDNYLIVRRDVPTCSSSLTINLPSDWEFEHFTVPPAPGWIISSPCPYRRTAANTGWVLPGIITSSAWKKSES